jgi:hypothetical protein
MPTWAGDAMHSPVRLFRWSVPLVGFMVSCGSPVPKPDKPGHMEVEWTGSNPGKLAGPATAEWCGPRRLLEIRSMQGDTGIGLAIYPAETIAVGKYRVVDPIKAESLAPAAGLAIRWLTQTTVQGFQGDSGTVELDRSGSGLLSGQVTAHARSVVDTQKVSVRARFHDLVVRREVRGCVAAPQQGNPRAVPGEPGVH